MNTFLYFTLDYLIATSRPKEIDVQMTDTFFAIWSITF